MSNFQAPALPQKPDAPDFCERGVFGPHSPHASHNPLHKGKLIFLAYFTGGVRVIDIRDPFSPVEWAAQWSLYSGAQQEVEENCPVAMMQCRKIAGISSEQS
jgi:hypothetical protein